MIPGSGRDLSGAVLRSPNVGGTNRPYTACGNMMGYKLKPTVTRMAMPRSVRLDIHVPRP